MSRSSLLQSLQVLLERTYRMETGVTEIGRYVIGDEGYRRFYGSLGAGQDPERDSSLGGEDRARPLRIAGSAGAGARVLVHDGPGPIAAHIYYPDVLIRSLEESPPTLGLGDRNIDPFATFVEELDHFLLIAERARLEKPVSLLELEIHANVTKYLVCALFMAAGRGGGSRGSARAPLDEASRLWLLWNLFEKARFAEPDPVVQCRYQDATRFARRFLDLLDGEPNPPARLARLRAFHDSTHQEKLASLA